MERKLQNLIFPTDEKLQAHWKLYYRSGRCAINKEHDTLYVPAYQTIDFATYLNGFSNKKWKQYTNLGKVRLYLEISGEFDLNLIGYHLNPYLQERSDLGIFHYNAPEKQLVVLEYPENTEQILSFEIIPFTNCVIYGGYFTGEYQESDVREVNLSLVTTTCFKEEFIKHNIGIIKEGILDSQEEISEHFFVHVIDNGRTLNPEEFNCEHLTVHPNKNTGGAGGFTRGMLESIHQETEITNVLLMDDDVLILPEALKKTYMLLTVLKDEYKSHFIGGAMLRYEEMNILHEDIGTIRPDRYFSPLKPTLNEEWIGDVLRGESDYSEYGHLYAAWWYCCIPMSQIEKNGLPLPLFIRGDDAEYGIRCNPGFITMNGICIWHCGFANKYNASMDLYQSMRNCMIAQATTGVCQNVDYIRRLVSFYRIQVLQFEYNAAELVLKALEDFMAGPDFIKQDSGEKILGENRKYNEKMIPLSEYKGNPIALDTVFDDPERSFMNRLLYKATYNGHICWPSAWLKKEPEAIAFDWPYQPGKQAFRSQLVAVNVLEKTVSVRNIDKKRFKELHKRFHKDMRYYKKHHQEIEKQYRDARDYLTSEEFWRKYLEI